MMATKVITWPRKRKRGEEGWTNGALLSLLGGGGGGEAVSSLFGAGGEE